MERGDKKLMGYFASVNLFDAGLTFLGNNRSTFEIGPASFLAGRELEFTEALIVKTIFIAGIIGLTAMMAHLKEVKLNPKFIINTQYVSRKTLELGTAFYLGVVFWNELNIILDKLGGYW